MLTVKSTIYQSVAIRPPGAFDALHCYAPLGASFTRMNHLLADFAISAANAQIFIGAAKAAHRMTFEMRKR